MAHVYPGLKLQKGLRALVVLAGLGALALGSLLALIGIISLITDPEEWWNSSNLWLVLLGLYFQLIGVIGLICGWIGPGARYFAGELVPVGRDVLSALGIAGAAEREVACTHCGGHSPASALFCIDCAKPLKVRCETCETQNPHDASYCGGCARRVAVAA